MIMRLSTFLAALGLVLGLSSAVHAEETLLTVSFDGQSRSFDRAALNELGTQTIETTTIWTEGVQTFQGVPLAALMADIGAEEGTIRAMAINDYTVEIPMSDAVEGGPIIAMVLNGGEMSVRDKGPLWVVYPYDTNADYRSEIIYSRSIWQLDRIEVVQ